MGLDITAYRKLQEVRPRNKELDDEGYDEGLSYFYENTDFPGRFDDLKEGVLYSNTERFGFKAGSYSGYNRWRERLAKLAGYPPTEAERSSGAVEMLCAAACWNGATGPFSELINFADNEGAIGSVVAAKLAADFAEWDDRAKGEFGDSWDYTLYQQWRKAFAMAADRGAVDFH